MGRIEVEEKLQTIFPVAIEDNKRFNRAQYASIMSDLDAAYAATYEEMGTLCKEEESSDEFLTQMALKVLDHAMRTIDETKSKRKKSVVQIDYNMALAAIILPHLDEYHEPYMVQFTEEIMRIWNEKYPAYKLTKATRESVQSGFKTGLCYITTAVCNSLDKPDDCYELTLLRNYRDEYLLKDRVSGQAIVEEYYNIAPTIVKHINKQEDADAIYEHVWKQYLSPCITYIEQDQLEECKKIYSDMVRVLQKTYFIS